MRFFDLVFILSLKPGFLEKEIRKDDIPMLDTGENPDAPQPREMIDLEVRLQVTVECLLWLSKRLNFKIKNRRDALNLILMQ